MDEDHKNLLRSLIVAIIAGILICIVGCGGWYMFLSYQRNRMMRQIEQQFGTLASSNAPPAVVTNAPASIAP